MTNRKVTSPFGVRLGATPKSAELTVNFPTLPGAHPLLKRYSGEWSPTRLLYSISGITDEFDEDPYARKALVIYEQLKTQLSKSYGPPELYETIDRNSRYSDDDEFCAALQRGDRAHFSVWETSTDDGEPCSIRLAIFARDYEKSQVFLTYELDESDQDSPAAGSEYL